MSVEDLGTAVANIFDSYQVYAGHEIGLVTYFVMITGSKGYYYQRCSNQAIRRYSLKQRNRGPRTCESRYLHERPWSNVCVHDQDGGRQIAPFRGKDNNGTSPVGSASSIMGRAKC
jgi:hypothetical protein